MSGFQFEITPTLNVEQVKAAIAEINAELDALKAQEASAKATRSSLAAGGVGTVQDSVAKNENAAEIATLRTQISTLKENVSVLIESIRSVNLLEGEAAGDLTALAASSRDRAGNVALNEATAELALARRQEAANAQITLNNRLIGAQAGSDDALLLESEARARVQAQVIAADQKLADIAVIETEGRREYVGLLSQSAEQQALLAAEIRASTEALKAGDANYAAAQASLIRSKVEQAIAIRAAVGEQDVAAVGAGGQTQAQLEATAAYDKQVASLEQRVELNRLLLSGDQEAITLQAEANVLQAQINAIRKEQEAVGLRAVGLPVPGENSSGGSSGNSAVVGGGLLGGGLGGLAKFALGAAAFATVASAVFDSLKETSALQKQLSILKTQLEQTDRSGDFPVLKQGLFDIGKETGIATSELAALAVQISGAFQGSGGSRGTPQFVLDQVKSAGEIQKLYGLSGAEVTNGLTSLAYTFDTTFQDIGDKAAGLQSRFGVTARELITSISQIAPVAKEMGLSFDQLALISASAERETGRTGVSVTEALGRVLPNIAQHTADVLDVYTQNANLAGSYDKIVKDIASGKTGEVLLQLIRDWSKLSQVQKDALLSNLGGGRQAPQLAAVFGDPQLLKELNNPINDTGKLAKQFASLKDTIGQTLAQLKQAFLQFGISIAQLGLVPLLEDLAAVLKVILAIANPIVTEIAKIDSALGGFTSKVFGLVLALKALQLIATSNLFSGLAGRFGAGAAAAEGETAAVTSAGGFRGVVGGAGVGLAGLFPETAAGTATAVALGAGVSLILVNALASGFQKGVDEEIAKAKVDAQKNALTDKGVRLARAGSAPNFRDDGLPVKQSFGSSVLDIPRIEQGAYDAKNAILGQAGDKELVNDVYQKAVGTAIIEQIKAVTKFKKFKNAAEVVKQFGGANRDEDGTHIRSQDGSTNTQSINQVEPTDDVSFKALQDIRANLIKKFGKKYVDGLIKAARDAGSKSNVDSALASGDASAIDVATSSALDSSKADYKAGVISGQSYVQGLERNRNGILDVVSRNGKLNKKNGEDLSKYDAEIAAYYSGAIKSRLDSLRSIRQAQGFDIDTTDIAAEVGALKDSKFTDPAARSQVVNQIFADLRTVLQRRIDGAATAAEKLAIEQQGIEVPVDVKIAAIQPLLDQAIQESDLNVKKLQVAVEGAGVGNLQQFEQNVIALSNFLGISVYQAMKLLLEKMLQDTTNELFALSIAALTHGAWTKKTQQDFARLSGVATQLAGQLQDLNSKPNDSLQGFQPPEFGNVHLGNDQALAQQAAQEAQAAADKAAAEARAYATAQADLAAAYVEKDPVAAALAAIHSADVQYANAQTASEQVEALAAGVRAQHAYQDALNGITTAQGDLLAAWVANDPVLSAQVQITQANQAASVAVGQAAQLEAAAQQVKAQQALQLAIHNVFDSTINLAKAMAEFAGDAVAAAQDGLKEAQSALSYAVFSHAGDAAINNARGQVITAQGALRDAQLKEKEDTIDFNLQTKNISSAQAIAQYQALLSNADILQLTTQERRDLILKIQQLKGDLQKDLQFDLPSDLRLPTLYEARRLDQSGGSYQDNRTYQINLSSTDPASTEAAVGQITDALNSPSVFGSGARIY